MVGEIDFLEAFQSRLECEYVTRLCIKYLKNVTFSSKTSFVDYPNVLMFVLQRDFQENMIDKINVPLTITLNADITYELKASSIHEG